MMAADRRNRTDGWLRLNDVPSNGDETINSLSPNGARMRQLF